MNAVLLGAVAMATALLVGACEREGPAEQAGEEVDRAIEEAQDAAKDATN